VSAGERRLLIAAARCFAAACKAIEIGVRQHSITLPDEIAEARRELEEAVVRLAEEPPREGGT